MGVYRRPSNGVAAGDAIPFAFGGEYHLFHLSSPPGTINYPERVRTAWQHVRSKNLVEWEELPPALLPGEGAEPDANGVWTGSLIEHDGVFQLYYTGHRLGSKTPQTICHATSRDLVHFTKDPANPLILPDIARYESVDWRDPFVLWNEEEQVFWMLIAARLREGPKWRRGCIALATSPDLKAWKLQGEPLYAPMTTFCPECPEIFRLGGRWYLVYSRFSEDAGTIYRVADDLRGPWRVPERDCFDGRRWYASKSLPKGDDGRVFFGWVHDRSGDQDTGTWLWGGDFAAPREVGMDASGLLSVRLPGALAAAYDQPMPVRLVGAAAGRRGSGKASTRKPQSVSLSASGGFSYRFIDTSAPDYLFNCRFRSRGDPASFGLLFRTDDDLAGYALLFERARSSVALVRWPPPLDSFWADLVGRGKQIREVDGPRLVELPLKWDLDGQGVACQLLVSKSVLEAYVGSQIVISYRIYGKARYELGVFVEDGSVICGEIGLSGPHP